MNIQQIRIGSNNNLRELSQVKNQSKLQNSEQKTESTSEKIVDQYIHQEPEKSAGIYDKNGKVKDSENSTMTVKANEGKLSESGAGAGVMGGAPINSSNESSDDEDDSELEELEQQQAKLRQQLNIESDEKVKNQLRTQLQNIENEILQLKLK